MTVSGSVAGRRDELLGLGMAAGGAVAFGTLAVSAKFGYRAGADTLPLLATRFSIAALLLYLVRHATSRALDTKRRNVIRLGLLGALAYAFEASLFFIALEHARAGVVSLIFYSYPLWTSVLGIAVGLERFRLQLLVALALGTSGVVLIFSLPEGGLKGPLYAAAAALAVAVYFVLAQVFSRGVDAYSSATWTITGAAAALVTASAVTRQGLPFDALPAAGALGAATALAFLGLYGAVGRIGSARASIAMMLEPVATVLFAALLLDEELTARILLATALIVAALPILATKRRSALDSATV